MIRAQLLRWRPRPHAQRTESTPRVRPSGAASQLDPSPRSSQVSPKRMLKASCSSRKFPDLFLRDGDREGRLGGGADRDESLAVLPPARAVLARAGPSRQWAEALHGDGSRVVNP